MNAKKKPAKEKAAEKPKSAPKVALSPGAQKVIDVRNADRKKHDDFLARHNREQEALNG